MASCSCSHWWHAPIYLILSIFLAFIVISSFQPPPSTTTTTLDSTTQPLISFNATTALQNNGFTIMATLLQFSPQLFFVSSSSQHSATVFAIDDTAFSNISTTPYAIQLLLQYHTLPIKLTFQELVKKQNYSCLPTLVPFKNLSLTKFDHGNVVINDVTISHHDLFLDDFISIHGVLGPFTSLDYHQYNNNTRAKPEDFVINSPYCDDSLVITNKTNKINRSMKISQHGMEWVRMIRALSSTGFVSFAIGLNSVLDRVLEDYPDLGSVTILAPLDFGFVGSSNWLLGRIVRYHILSQRYNYTELAVLPAKTVLTTLLPGDVVEVTVNANVSHGVAVNGVDVVLSEIFSSRMFVVHGISRAMDFLDRAGT